MTAFSPLLVSLVLAITTVLLAGVVGAIWWMDRYDREPIPLMLGVFAWGALVCPFLTGAAGAAVLWLVGWLGGGPPDVAWVAVGLAPVVEEGLKAVGIVLVVALTREFDNPTDGLVYGTAVGLGFAVTENLVYTLAAASQGLPTLIVVDLVARRTLFTAGVHALGSAAVGAGFGFAKLAPHRWQRVAWVVAGLMVAVVLHGGWNFSVVAALESEMALVPWLIMVPLYGMYGGGLALLLRAEHLVLRRQMQEEVALGVLPAWTAEVIPYYRRRVRSDWWPARHERTVIARHLTRLAFRKHALSAAGRAGLEGLEVVRLRQRVQQILNPPPAEDE